MRQGLGQVKSALLLFGTALLSACERAAPTLGAGGAYIVMPVMAGRPATLYFVVDATSFGDAPLPRIRKVGVEGAARAEIHRSMTMDGMARMQPLEAVPLVAGVTRFCPGGLHVMLFGLDERLKVGAQTRVHIALSDGKHLDPDAKVVSLGDTVEADAPYSCADAAET